MKQVADQLRGVRVLVAIAVLAVIAALAIAGCGDSSDATGEGTTASGTTAAEDSGATLTKALVIKKGDAICAKTDDIQRQGLEAFEKKNPGAVQTPKGLEEVIVEVALPAVSTEIEELKALPAPSDEVAPLTSIYEAMEKALRSAEKNPLSVGKSLGPFREPAKMAKFFGFRECANAL